MSNEKPKKKIGGLIIACIVAILMGIRFSMKGIRFVQIDDTSIRTMGGFLLLCGLVLIVLAIVLMIKNVKKNSEEK